MKRELALLHGTLSVCGVVRTRHARPHPHPAHRTRMAFATLSLSSTRASHTQRQRARGTSSPYHHFVAFSVEREDTCRANPSCVLLPCRPDNPCPPSTDGVVSAVPARRRSSRSRVCLHAVEEPPPVALWRALCRAPTCPDVERPLITLIGPSQWSHLDRSRRSPYTLA